jgi:outer membrane protein
MKKLTAIICAVLFATSFGLAQRVAHVDTEYILSKIPAYEQAQKSLDNLSQNWQKEIETKRADIDQLYKKYQSEKVLLSDDMRTKREEEIISKEKDVKDLQKKYFGKDGDLYNKRQELIKPIQDELHNTIKEVAIEGNFDYIFDKATGAILYANDKYDKSDEILKKLGY